MARRRRLTLALGLLLARAALAADPCQEGRLQTGVSVAPGTDGLSIASVDDDSAAAAGGLRAGDRVVQANASVLGSCDDWARAVRDARRERKALLLLVRRADGEVPLLLAQATWTRAVAVTPAVPPPAPPAGATETAPAATPPAAGTATAPTATAPTATAPTGTAPTGTPSPPPPPKPRVVAPSVATIVSEPPPAPGGPSAQLEDVLKALESLAPAEPAHARIGAYQQQLLRVHRQIETLAARDAAPPRAITGLRTVVRYYDAAEVAWEAEEALRERDKRPRHVPTAEGTAAPYFAESDAEATVDEFPFLRETVVREPGTGVIEISGLWQPVRARTLLWEKGREELGRLAEWLRSGR